MTTTRRSGAGSATVELVLITPLLVVFLLLMVFAGRVVIAMGEVEAASRDAARAASLSRSPEAAWQAAQQTAAAGLAQTRRVTCQGVEVQVDTARFQPRQTATGATAGAVMVSVRCRVRLADLSLLGLSGSRVVERRATAPVDAFRGTE